MTIQTTPDETFEAQLRADDQVVLWLIDATDGRYQLAVALQGGWQILDATPSERVLLDEHGFASGRCSERRGMVGACGPGADRAR
jgi:hypothetical protein